MPELQTDIGVTRALVASLSIGRLGARQIARVLQHVGKLHPQVAAAGIHRQRIAVSGCGFGERLGIAQLVSTPDALRKILAVDLSASGDGKRSSE